MRRSTAIMAMYEPEAQEGENLQFERAKGGYFSVLPDLGLKVVGATAQDGTPTPDAPVPIQCVKAGTIITCGDCKIVTPCDLYEGDIWWPMTGRVERRTKTIIFDGTEKWVKRTYANAQNAYQHNPGFLIDTGKASHYKESRIIDVEDSIYLHNTDVIIVSDKACDTLEDFVRRLQSYSEQGNPLKCILQIRNALTEHYPPQPIHAPAGTVNVLQTPAELPGELSATMLVRR